MSALQCLLSKPSPLGASTSDRSTDPFLRPIIHIPSSHSPRCAQTALGLLLFRRLKLPGRLLLFDPVLSGARAARRARGVSARGNGQLPPMAAAHAATGKGLSLGPPVQEERCDGHRRGWSERPPPPHNHASLLKIVNKTGSLFRPPPHEPSAPSRRPTGMAFATEIGAERAAEAGRRGDFRGDSDRCCGGAPPCDCAPPPAGLRL